MQKRILILMLVLVAASASWAQKGETLIGTPVYYDTFGNPRGSAVPADSSYHLPRHHYLNNPTAALDDRYSGWFLELSGMAGSYDGAIGARLTYLPKRWGGYFMAMQGFEATYLSVGAALRLSGEDDWLDWHLYGGPMVGRDIGGEVGIRMALPDVGGTNFCDLSMAMGLAVMDGKSYITAGFGLSLAPVAAVDILLW